VIGVPEVAVPVRVCELERFDQHVEVVGRLGREAGHVERLDEVQRLKEREALGRRRGLEHGAVPIGRGDGPLPARGVPGEVVAGEEAPAHGDVLDDTAGHLPLVEGLRALGGQPGQAPPQVRLAQHRARAGPFPAGGVDPVPLRILDERCALGNRLGQQVRHREPVTGQGDGRLQELGQGPAPEPVGERAPAGDRPGHGDGQRALNGHGVEPPLAERLRRGAAPRAAGGVQEAQLAGGRVEVEDEEVAAEAAHVGLDHRQRRVDRDARVDHVPTGAEDVQAGERGGGMRGGYQPVTAVGDRAMGVAEDGHRALRRRAA